MVSIAGILAAMLSLAPSYIDRAESPEQRSELFRPVALTISVVARNEREAALLIADAWHETKYTRAILEGRCRDMPRGQRCDNLRARGQVHDWCKASDTIGEARCALRGLRGGVARCAAHSLTPWHAAFAGVAARECNWQGAEVRVRLAKRVLARLRKTE